MLARGAITGIDFVDRTRGPHFKWCFWFHSMRRRANYTLTLALGYWNAMTSYAQASVTLRR